MKSQPFHSRDLFLTVLFAALPILSCHFASAQVQPLVADTSEVRLTVRDAAGAPVPAARVEMVILSRGRDLGAIEATTDPQGDIEQDIIPVGDEVRMQISAPGFQTYGMHYPVNNLVKTVVVRLKPQAVQQTAVLTPATGPSRGAAAQGPAELKLVASNVQPAAAYKEPQWVSKPHRSAANAHVAVKGAKTQAQ